MSKYNTKPRWLTPEEIQELRKDMQESSIWAKQELQRRKAQKQKKVQ